MDIDIDFDPLPHDGSQHGDIDDLEDVLEGGIFDIDDHTHNILFSGDNDAIMNIHSNGDGRNNGGSYNPNVNPYSSDSGDSDNSSFGSGMSCNFQECTAGCGGGGGVRRSLLSKKERAQFIPVVPEYDITQEEADYHRSNELKGFTPEERERVFHDIRGTGHTVAETNVEEALYEMEFELNQISRNTSYQIALQQDASYVKNNKFRLKFLRAEYFQPRKAANRMVRYFEEKMMLFGPDR